MGLWAVVTALCVFGLSCGIAWGGESAHEQSSQPTPTEVLPEPSAEHVLAAHGLVRDWVSGWQDPPEPASTPPIRARVSGVCVTLRLPDGEIARGTAWERLGASTGESDRAARVLKLLQDATVAAMADAEPRLGVPNDARRQDSLRVMGKLIGVSVELAGPLGVIDPKTWEDAEVSLRPGLDGVAVRRIASDGTDRAFVAVFPSQMMLANQLPHRAIGRAVAEVIGDGGGAAALEEPSQIRSKHGVRMLAFRVAHAAQGSADAPATVLYRGQRLIPAGSVMTRAELGEMARRLTEHLIRRTIAAPNDKAGQAKQYVRTVRQNIIAPSKDEQPKNLETDGVVAFALTRAYHATANQDLKLASRGLALGVLIGVGDKPNEQPLASALAFASFNVQMEMPEEFEDAFLYNERLAKYRSQLSVLDPKTTDPRAMGFLVAAIEFQIESTSVDNIVRLAERDRVYVESLLLPSLGAVKPENLPTAMPSLGWGMLKIAYARAGVRGALQAHKGGEPQADEPPEGQDIPGAVSLRRMRELCWTHQLQVTNASPDTLDMIGGIVFTTGGGGRAAPYPTWQCVRPLAFIATMLADIRLTEPSERGGEIVKLMAALRYLRQLEVDQSSVWMYPNPALAMGGIRASTWDNNLPAEATALTLLCVLEAMDSLDRIAAEGAGQPPTGSSGKGPQAPYRWFESQWTRFPVELPKRP